jgi:hypothetical protein
MTGISPQQQLSFIFIPARSVSGNFLTDLNAIKDFIDPVANFFRTIAPTYLPAALASLISSPAPLNPFFWVDMLPPEGSIWIHPNSLGFAEYVAFSEVVPVEESPLRSKSLMAAAVATGAKIGLIAGGATPLCSSDCPRRDHIVHCGRTLRPGPGRQG